MIINLSTEVCILIYKIILHLNLLIISINVQWLWVNCIPSLLELLQVTKCYSGELKIAYPRSTREPTQ